MPWPLSLHDAAVVLLSLLWFVCLWLQSQRAAMLVRTADSEKAAAVARAKVRTLYGRVHAPLY